MKKISLLLALLCEMGSALAEDPVQRVDVRGTRADQRVLETHSIITVGHDELVRQGDANLADALKRLPGITIAGAPGRAGEIRLRGLGNGYTQVLVNGLPVPPGFSPESIAPELVERVEILRAPTAETGAQAIAGTINIVLRKSMRQDAKLGMASQAGHASPSLSVEHASKSLDTSLGLALAASRNYTGGPSATVESGDVRRQTNSREDNVNQRLNLSPRIVWNLGPARSLSLQSVLLHSQVNLTGAAHEDTTLGEPSEFPDNYKRFTMHANSLRSDLQYLHSLEGGARLSVTASALLLNRDSDFDFVGEGAQPGTHHVDGYVRERNVTLAAKLAWTDWSAGGELAQSQRQELRDEVLRGASSSRNTADQTAIVQRLAAFVQHEWNATPATSVSAGLRGEIMRTTSIGVRQNSAILSPMLHLMHKAEEGNQFRVALSRSFKAPSTFSLLPRRYTVDNNNSPVNPDNQGNPTLRPEIALGLDAGWERFFDKNMFGLNVFVRSIKDPIGLLLQQKDGIWFLSPSNGPRALLRGIELEAKRPLLEGELRANLNRNWSPLEKQVPISGSVALNWSRAGISYSVQGGAWYRQSAAATAYTGIKRELDVYYVLQTGASTRLRLSAANLLQQDFVSRGVYAGPSLQRASVTRERNGAILRLQWELAAK